MTFFSKMSDSAGLASGMATRLDIDARDRMAAGADTIGRSFAAIVMRCTHCPEHAACRALQEEAPMLDRAPDYCRNKDVLVRRD